MPWTDIECLKTINFHFKIDIGHAVGDACVFESRRVLCLSVCRCVLVCVCESSLTEPTKVSQIVMHWREFRQCASKPIDSSKRRATASHSNCITFTKQVVSRNGLCIVHSMLSGKDSIEESDIFFFALFFSFLNRFDFQFVAAAAGISVSLTVLLNESVD